MSGYHWTDGIGPAGARPRRPELAWLSEESNRFGTDEFMAWCARAGVEPVLCLNMGTGAVIAMVPCVVLYLTLQRYYVQGLMSGAVKG